MAIFSVASPQNVSIGVTQAPHPVHMIPLFIKLNFHMKHCWFKSSHCPRLLSWVAGPITAWRRGNGGMSHMWAKYKLVWIFLFRDGVASSPPPHPRISLKMCCMCEYSMWVRFPMGAILLVWSSPWDEPWIWHCFFFFLLFFLVYCELWTNNRFINIIAITIIIVFYTDVLLLF